MALVDRDLDLRIKMSNLNECLGKNKHVNQINPLVSIVVETYQHVGYIDECIKSILMQKTSFPIEIIIGEDESTDGTREICMRYAEKYPDKIRLFLRSRKDVMYINGNPTGKFNGRANAMAARGKYIACCEGDDYWTDKYKLEKQVSYMEKNPDCSLCCHAAHIVNVDEPESVSYARPCKANKLFNVEEVIQGHGGFLPTSSLVYRTDLVKKMPEFSNDVSFGDYPLSIFLSLCGKVYYIDEFMSVYRINVPGSWNCRMALSVQGLDIFDKEYTDVLENINRYTNFKYEHVIKKTIQEAKFNVTNDKVNLMLTQGLFKELKNGEFKNIYSSFSRRKKFKIFVNQYISMLKRIYLTLVV